MFNQPSGLKERVCSALEAALNDIKSGRITVHNITSVSSPQARDIGLAHSDEQSFWGIAFSYNKPKSPVKTTIPTPPSISPDMGLPMTTGSSTMKITNREVERLRDGMGYLCPCGFRTNSSTGIKKHANRCQKWKQEYRQRSG